MAPHITEDKKNCLPITENHHKAPLLEKRSILNKNMYLLKRNSNAVIISEVKYYGNFKSIYIFERV
jgi:hypothetical protein